MAAFIPNRRDVAVTEAAIARVRDDKLREAGEGFDGTWVAHPDLVGVALDVFDAQLGTHANQLERQREDVTVAARELLDARVPGGVFTDAELRNNVVVSLRYLAAWLGGTGAVAINNLMEDAATAEIARSQLWQWARHAVRLDTGVTVTRELIRDVLRDEARALAEASPTDAARIETARELVEATALGESLADFITLPGYERLE
jgi:malate synthase